MLGIVKYIDKQFSENRVINSLCRERLEAKFIKIINPNRLSGVTKQ